MKNGIRVLIILACLVSASCRTPNVNPPAPRANTGYVDFHTDSDLALSWEVKRESEKTGEMRTVFSEFKPVEGTILRLAAPPGTHRFQIWFINAVTEGPKTVSVQVQNGKITPVHVTLTRSGSASVESTTYEYRPTPRATRRVTRSATDQSVAFQIGAVSGAPLEYQPKERMPYWAITAE